MIIHQRDLNYSNKQRTRTITTLMRIPPFAQKGAHKSAKYSYIVFKIALHLYFITIYLCTKNKFNPLTH